MPNYITGATTLSIEEASSLPHGLLIMDHDWWLRSPGHRTNYAAYVDTTGHINSNGRKVNRNTGVRPALILAPNHDIPADNSIIIGDYVFDIICDKKYALCDSCIDISPFRIDSTIYDANSYSSSDIRQTIDRWFKERIHEKKISISEQSYNVLPLSELVGIIEQLCDENYGRYNYTIQSVDKIKTNTSFIIKHNNHIEKTIIISNDGQKITYI